MEEFGEKARKELFEAMIKNTVANEYSKKQVYSTFGEAMQRAGAYKDIANVESSLSVIRGFLISVSNPYATGSNLIDECGKLERNIRMIR